MARVYRDRGGAARRSAEGLERDREQDEGGQNPDGRVRARRHGRNASPPRRSRQFPATRCYPLARALAAYQAQRWDEAIVRFRETDALRGGDPPSRTYVERCEAMKKDPPGAGWDGVFDMKTK